VNDRFVVTNKTLFSLLTMAYGMNCLNVDTNGLLSGGPAWIRMDQFDIDAVIPESFRGFTTQQFNAGEAPKLRAMLQNLLAERFNLTMHRETKELPVYVLRVGTSAPKLTPAPETGNTLGVNPRRILATKVSMSGFADVLALLARRIVVDHTGIMGEFSIDLAIPPADINAPPGTPPTFISAIQEQLGLLVEDTAASMEVVVIDQAEKPSEN